MKKRLASTIDDSTKLDRKTIERNRRIHMKSLCHQLGSLIPPNLKPPKSKLMLGQQDQLDLAARYIKHMRERIEKLKRQKEQAMLNQSSDRKMLDKNVDTKLTILELRDLGSGIEVMLVSGLNKTFMLYEVISVLEEEGAEVVTASFSTVGDKLFYVVHAQVKISRVGVETTRVKDRLQEFIAPLEIWPEEDV
ncbi:Achaete-scute transcription factor-related [Vigna unguiculata]|uniref:Achaete-scute transcription factor-related n=1 Tax=Vigna unguiculata TaxID=3917 RepID=A0A4D6LDH0_VIGUN|nr:Achaete-scute transcription factor-related [Vigna unguiculata]